MKTKQQVELEAQELINYKNLLLEDITDPDIHLNVGCMLAKAIEIISRDIPKKYCIIDLSKDNPFNHKC